MNALAPVRVPAPTVTPSREIAVRPHPFHADPMRVTVEEGLTLDLIVLGAGLREEFHPFVRVWIDDQEIDRRYWSQVRPKSGRQVYVSVTPQGGDGGFMRSLLMLVVTVAASAFAPMVAGALFPGAMAAGGFMAPLATAAVGAGISLLGALAVSALVPPPSQDSFPGQRAFQASVRNRFEPYAFIPQTFGRRRVYPLLAARPFTEASGSKRWLRVLLCVGWGPLAITNIKIGNTPITSFPNIRVEVREGWHADHAQFGTLPPGKSPDEPHKLFTQSVNEETFNTLLAPNVWQTRTTQPNTTEISVDVTCPLGLMTIQSNGDRDTRTVDVDVQYRKVGTTTWNSVTWDGGDEPDGTETNGRIRLRAKSYAPVIRGGRWELPEAAQWEVRLRRTTSNGSSRNAERVEWTALRSITKQYPVAVPGLATIALFIKATDEFNGLPDTINCEVESYLPSWNGSTWSWGLSRNPAWAFTDALRRQGTKRRMADGRIDLPAMRSWAAACAATAPNAPEPRWRFDGTLDAGSLFESLRLIASHGRASYVLKDGLHSVVRDTFQATPVQHITPRNSWGYSGMKRFIERPHALKVQFINAANGWREDETIVYDDGYTAANAERFEVLDLPGVTSQTQAWREGRYHLAVGKLRTEEHSVYQDVENLRCTKGDRVQFSHDVISVGVGSGRIVSRTTSGSNVLTVTLDNEVPLKAGVSYAMRVRRANGTISLYTLAGVGADTQTATLTLSPAVATASAPAVGDLVTVGEATRETMPMIVKAIEPGPDMTAKLTLIAYDEGILNADTTTIPAWSSYANDDTPPDQQQPPEPLMTLVSNEAAMERLADGTLVERIVVGIAPLPPTRRMVGAIEVQWRPSGTLDWEHAPGSPGAHTRLSYVIDGVRVGQAYDVRARTISEDGMPSLWTTTLGHVVVGRTTPPASVADFTAETLVGGVRLRWTANPEIDVTGYEIRRGASWDAGTVEVSHTTATERFIPLPAYASATFWIKARDSLGLMSDAAVSVVGNPRKPGLVDIDPGYRPGDDGNPPPQVTGVVAFGAIRSIWIEWTATTDADFAFYEIFEQATATPAPVLGTAATFRAGANHFVRENLPDNATRHYWIRAVDTSGRRSTAWSARVEATTQERAGVTSAIIAGLVDATSFAANLEPITIVPGSTLPTAKSTSAIWFQNDLYRWNGSAYVKSVAAADVAGALALGNFPTDLRPIERVAALPTTGNFQGRTVYLTTDNKIYRHTGSPSGAAGFTAAVPAGDIAGQLTNAQIADLAASKLTGQITGTQIGDSAISTPKIAAGAIETSKIAAGAVTATEIAAGAVTTAKLAAGAVTANAIAANAVTAGKIAAGAVSTDQLAANAVTAAKMLVIDRENLIPEFNFEEGDAALFSRTSGTTLTFTTEAVTGSRAAVFTRPDPAAAATLAGLPANYVAVKPGETYWIECEARDHLGGSHTGALNVRIRWYDANKAQLAVTGTGARDVSAAWATHIGRFVAPAGARFATADLLMPAGTGVTSVRIDRCVMRRANAGQLVVDGSISANALTIGSNSNLLSFTDARDGTRGWTTGFLGAMGAQCTLTTRAPGQTYAGLNYPTYGIYQNGTAAQDLGTSHAYAYSLGNNRDQSTTPYDFPVEPNAWYDFSAKVGALRCGGAMGIVWYDATGAQIGTGPQVGFSAGSVSSTNPQSWPLRWCIGQAPSNAAYGRVFFNKGATSTGSDSWLFWHRPMVSRTHPAATEPTPYTPPDTTFVDGGRLFTGSITAASGVIGSLAVGTLQIAGEAVSGTRHTAYSPGSPFYATALTTYHTWSWTLPHETRYLFLIDMRTVGSFSGDEEFETAFQIDGSTVLRRDNSGARIIGQETTTYSATLAAGTHNFALRARMANWSNNGNGVRGIANANVFCFGAVK